MIPKIIHYIWLGGGDIPKQLQSCINSWKVVMPEYDFIKWDDNSITEINIPFVHEAINEKKWAFASDVIRLWAVNKYGGIYLDTDVMAYHSFDSLLSYGAFIGREKCLNLVGKNTEYHLSSYCFGAEKDNPFIKACLDYYASKHFINSRNENIPLHLRLDIRNASYIYSEIARLFGYDPSALAASEQKCNGDLMVLSPEVLSDSSISEKAIVHHLYVGSWRESPIKEPVYNLKYKIQWRLLLLFERLLKHFGYIMIKLR